MMTGISTWVLAAGLAADQPADGTASLGSPGGGLTIAFQTVSEGQPAAAGGQLVYRVSFHGKPLIEPSALRLDLQGQRPLGTEVRIVGAALTEADETYRLVAGKASSVRDRHRALRLWRRPAARGGSWWWRRGPSTTRWRSATWSPTSPRCASCA